MFGKKEIIKKLDEIEKQNNEILERLKFEDKIIELGKLRNDVYNTKSLVKIGKIINESPYLNKKTFYSKKLESVSEKDKLIKIRERVLNYINYLITKEVMKINKQWKVK